MEYLFLAASSIVSAITNAFHPRACAGERHIVVFKLDHIGDLVTAVPELRRIRGRHPDAEVTLVVGSWCEELATSLLPVDVVAVYDSPRFERGVGGPSGARRGLREILARRSYDLAYGFRDDAASLGFCLFGGAARRRDRGTIRIRDRMRRMAAVMRHQGDPGPLSEAETNLLIVDVHAEPDPDTNPLAPRRIDVERVTEDVRRARSDAGGPLVVLHPGAVWGHRRWPADRYSDLAVRLRDEFDAVVFVTGSSDERELADRAFAPGAGRVVAGEYGISTVSALLAQADVFVGADTGITHLASAMGAPVVVLFGPGDPRRFSPIGERVATLYERQDCSPCAQTVCNHDSACMKAITVEAVLQAVRGILRSVDAVSGQCGGASCESCS